MIIEKKKKKPKIFSLKVWTQLKTKNRSYLQNIRSFVYAAKAVKFILNRVFSVEFCCCKISCFCDRNSRFISYRLMALFWVRILRELFKLIKKLELYWFGEFFALIQGFSSKNNKRKKQQVLFDFWVLR